MRVVEASDAHEVVSYLNVLVVLWHRPPRAELIHKLYGLGERFDFGARGFQSVGHFNNSRGAVPRGAFGSGACCLGRITSGPKEHFASSGVGVCQRRLRTGGDSKHSAERKKQVSGVFQE